MRVRHRTVELDRLSIQTFVAAHAAELDALVDPGADRRFEYFGLRTVTDRYLLRHPHTRLVMETPQHSPRELLLVGGRGGFLQIRDVAEEGPRLVRTVYLPAGYGN
jgi:hypothetical protein